MASAAFPNLAKKVTLSDGTTYGYIHVPAAISKPTFLLLHGAPSSSYIWHHQVELLPKAGFGVLVPDLLGYGDTDRPDEAERYRLQYICPQVAELVGKVMGDEKVIGVGHDWGALTLSRLYVMYKHIFSSLVFVAVGFNILDQEFDIDTVNAAARSIVGHSTSAYVKLFSSPEGASLVERDDKVFDSLMYAKDPKAWIEHLGAEDGLRKFLDAGKALPIADWISPEELEMHNRIMKGGYDGVFNWYKALMLGPSKEDKALTAEDKIISVPTLHVATAKDYVILEDIQKHLTQAAAKDCRVERVDTGHWTMLEDRDQFEGILESRHHTHPHPPGLTYLYTAIINGSTTTYNVGDGPRGTRIVFPIAGGSFSGPRISGSVVPVGGDWALVDANGTLTPGRYTPDVRQTFQTDDGAFIQIFETGSTQANGTAHVRLTYETGSAQYYWLNSVVAIGTISLLTESDIKIEAWQMTTPPSTS